MALVAVVVAVCAMLVAACGSGDAGGGSSTNADGKLSGTLKILGVAGIARATAELAKQFEQENPGVTVKVENIPDAQIAQVEQARITSGEAPDVMHVQPGYGDPSSIKVQATQGVAMDLSDQPWAKDVPEAFLDSSSLNGRIYGLVATFQLIGAFYDKKVFAQLGLTPPTTYQELLSTCGKIAAAGKIPIAVGAQDFSQIFLGHALASSNAYAEDPDFPQKRLDDEVTFAGTKGWVDALDKYDEMNRAGCFGDAPTGTSFEAAQQEAATGKAVMFPSVLQSLGPLKDANPRGDWAMFPVPGNDDPALVRVPLGGSYGFGIPAKAKNPELAKAFLAFVARPENDVEFAKLASVLPVYSGDGASLGGSSLPPGTEAVRPYLDEGKTVTFLDQFWPASDVYTRYMKGMQAMLSGDGTTPEDILESMDEAWTSPK